MLQLVEKSSMMRRTEVLKKLYVYYTLNAAFDTYFETILKSRIAGISFNIFYYLYTILAFSSLAAQTPANGRG